MVQWPWWHWGAAGGWAAFRAGGGVRTRKSRADAAGEAGLRQAADGPAGRRAGQKMQTHGRQ